MKKTIEERKQELGNALEDLLLLAGNNGILKNEYYLVSDQKHLALMLRVNEMLARPVRQLANARHIQSKSSGKKAKNRQNNNIVTRKAQEELHGLGEKNGFSSF